MYPRNSAIISRSKRSGKARTKSRRASESVAPPTGAPVIRVQKEAAQLGRSLMATLQVQHIHRIVDPEGLVDLPFRLDFVGVKRLEPAHAGEQTRRPHNWASGRGFEDKQIILVAWFVDLGIE